MLHDDILDTKPVAHEILFGRGVLVVGLLAAELGDVFRFVGKHEGCLSLRVDQSARVHHLIVAANSRKKETDRIISWRYDINGFST